MDTLNYVTIIYAPAWIEYNVFIKLKQVIKQQLFSRQSCKAAVVARQERLASM